MELFYPAMNNRCARTVPWQKAPIRFSRGFSLTEVLVSMLVLAIGVLGAAGLQLAATRTTQQAAFQTLALQLASEMADKMRANDAQMKQAGGLFLAVDYKSASDGEPSVPGKLCYAASCDAAELAAFDIYEWESRVKEALPGGRVLICRDSSPWDSGQGRLIWDCSGSSTTNASYVIKVGWQGKNPDGSLIKNAESIFPPSVALTVKPYIQ